MSGEFYLDGRTAELVAVGASVAANCLPCLRYHFAEAAKAGCSPEGFNEAVELARRVKTRPTTDMTKLVTELVARERERRVTMGKSADEEDEDANV